MAIVTGTPTLEPELANGYNSGDEYTGRTGNNLTIAEWQEVCVFRFFLEYSNIGIFGLEISINNCHLLI